MLSCKEISLSFGKVFIFFGSQSSASYVGPRSSIPRPPCSIKFLGRFLTFYLFLLYSAHVQH